MSSTVWETPGNTSAIILTKSNGEVLRLAVDDFVTYKERVGGVRIVGFTHIDNGHPIGMTYLPWRYQEKRWATLAFGVKGNDRHIILPDGGPHYGQHIDWELIQHCDPPSQ